MFPHRYFAVRYFNDRYFPESEGGVAGADYPPRRWRVAALARGNKRRKRR